MDKPLANYYVIKYWNNGDKNQKWKEITKIDESYAEFQKLTCQYDNVQWIETIYHILSARGNEACDIPPIREIVYQ